MEQQQFFIDSITAHFNLRYPKSNKPTPIYFIIRVGRTQYKIPLGCKVYPFHWDKKKQKAYVGPGITDLDNRNNFIANNKISIFLVGYMKALNYICTHPNTPSEEIRDIIIKEIGGKRMARRKENALIELGVILDEQAMTDGSKDGYHSELKSFTTFVKEKMNKSILYWEEITLTLMTDYEAWLHQQTVQHKITHETVYMEDNTVIAKMQKIYTLLTYAERKERIDLQATKINKLKNRKKRKDKTEENQIYLTEEEFLAIRNQKLDGEMEQVRDLFVFQNEVGQRYQDINGIRPTLKGNNKIEIIQQKTSKRVTPPLTDTAKQILEKYNWHLPKVGLPKTNKLLKEIAKNAGIVRPVTACEMRNGKQYRYEVEGWQCVGSHTARRSYISNGLKTKDGSVIRKITGHSTMDAFERYNRLDTEDAADVLSGNYTALPKPQQANQQPQANSISLDVWKAEIIESYDRQRRIEELAKEIDRLRLVEKECEEYKMAFGEDELYDRIADLALKSNEPWEF